MSPALLGERAETRRRKVAVIGAGPAGLAAAALDLLEKLRLVVRVPGGVLALPALARYRGVTVTVRERDPRIDLYPGDSSEAELS